MRRFICSAKSVFSVQDELLWTQVCVCSMACIWPAGHYCAHKEECAHADSHAWYRHCHLLSCHAHTPQLKCTACAQYNDNQCKYCIHGRALNEVQTSSSALQIGNLTCLIETHDAKGSTVAPETCWCRDLLDVVCPKSSVFKENLMDTCLLHSTHGYQLCCSCTIPHCKHGNQNVTLHSRAFMFDTGDTC